MIKSNMLLKTQQLTQIEQQYTQTQDLLELSEIIRDFIRVFVYRFENFYLVKYPGKISILKYIVEIHNTTLSHMSEAMWLIVGVLSVRTGYTTQQRLKSVEGHNKLYTNTDGLSRRKTASCKTKACLIS